jgi:lipopolysaccharide biosynthesis glycosyltransferase
MGALSSRRGQRGGGHGTNQWWRNARAVCINKPWILSICFLVSMMGLWRSEQDESSRLMSLSTSRNTIDGAYTSAVSMVLASLPQSFTPEQDSCRMLDKYEGPISLVWAWHDPPAPGALQSSIDSIVAMEAISNIQVDIYCGSTECMNMAKSAADGNRCVNVHFMVVPTLAQDSPLEEWAGDHLLAKLLHANYFEETLQVAMQLVILWKHGGVVMLPGSIATTEFSNALQKYHPTVLVQKESDEGMFVIPNGGLSAIASSATHPTIVKMMESIVKLSSWPTYDPKQWPVHVKWDDLFSKIVENSAVNAVSTSGLVDTSPKELRISGEKKRHFGSLTYQARRSYLKSKGNMGMNRGDEMQGLGGLQFLPRLDAFVERDRLDVVSVIGSSNFSSSSQAVTPSTPPRPAETPTTVFLNAWYGTPDMVWPPPGKLEPIFVAMHLNNQKVKDKFAESTDYLSKHWPIGARDTSTESFFKSVGVHSLFSACMTMTLRPSVSRERQQLSRTEDDILIVDVTDRGLEILPKHVRMAARSLTAKITDKEIVDDQLGRYILAHEMKSSLQKAKLVVTQRLHIALPAASMGTPVILILDDALPGGGGANGNSRFSGLQAAVHTINIHSEASKRDASKQLKNFNWDEPPPNPSPETIMVRRNALQVLAMCHGMDLYDSGRKFGVIPSDWKFPSERSVCEKTPYTDENVIHIASAIDPEWLDSYPVFSSWINALHQSNSDKKFAFYLLTNKMTTKQRCLVRWIVSKYFPDSQVYTIATDEYLSGLPYKGIKHVPLVTQSRLLMEKLLPCVDHLLWIDSDAFVAKDIADLWEQRLSLPDCGIAGRESVKSNVIGGMIDQASLVHNGKKLWDNAAGGTSGFNAGVLLLSLERLRETKFLEKIASHWSFKLGGNDQIALNMQCNGTYGILDSTWNVFQYYEDDPVYENPEEWGIVHMQGSKKPWIESRNSLHDQFWERFHLPLVEALMGPQQDHNFI